MSTGIILNGITEDSSVDTRELVSWVPSVYNSFSRVGNKDDEARKMVH